MLRMYSRLAEWSRRRRVLPYLAVFLLAAGIFAYLQWQPAFSDPDSFYHAKMGQLTAQQGIVRDFPWLPYTTLAASFADHHYLYHLLLVPFVLAAGPLLGTKIACVLFAALAILCFYALLRAHRARYPALFALMLATAGGFIFRLNLAKASSLSICLVLLSLLAIRLNRPRLLFVFAWAFVWLYGGWPIMLIIAGCFWLARFAFFLVDRASLPERRVRVTWLAALRLAWSDRRIGWLSWTETRDAAVIAGGLAAGLVINPFFPRNLSFYWEQIVQIAVVGYQGTIAVGAEWYPYSMAELFGKTSIVFLIFSVALVMLLAVIFWGRSNRVRPPEPAEMVRLAAAFLLTVVFLALALRSRRHIEYLMPFALWFDALLISMILPWFRPTADEDDDDADKRRFVAKFVVVYLLVLAPLLAARDVYAVRTTFDKGIAWSKYEKAAVWLRENTPENAIVFHSDWDDFPVLFLHDDRNRYIIGLDPTFLFRQDQLRYWQYVHLTKGERLSGNAAMLTGSFDARYVLVENDHDAMRRAIEGDPDIHLVYSDEDAKIYAVLPPL